MASVAVVAGWSLAALTTASAADGLQPGTQDGGRATQAGWWTTTNEPPPDSGVANPPAVPEPIVPKGALPVSVLLGEQQRISAIQFALDGAAGSSVRSFQLVLRESTAPGAAANVDTAKVLACPITDAFWVPEEGGAWKRRPAFDCKLGSAAGRRDAKKGLWEFDLTSLAATWLATDYAGSRSIVLVGGVAGDQDGEPSSFQVTFEGIEAKGIGVLVRTAKKSGPAEAAPASPGGEAGGSGAEAGGEGAAAGGATGGGGNAAGGAVGDAGAVGGAEVVAPPAPIVPAADDAPVAAAPPGSPQPVEQGVARVASEDLPWYSGLGWRLPLLALFAAGLAYLVMLAMGPDARPTVLSGRRGVSRALDRVRAAGAGLAGKLGR